MRFTYELSILLIQTNVNYKFILLFRQEYSSDR